MKSDAGLPAVGKRWITIGWRAALHIPRQRHGETEQAVLKGLTLAQADGSFIRRDGGLNVDDTAGGADIAGDIGTGWFTGAEGHRHRLRGGFEFVATDLQDGTGGETHLVFARQFGDESPWVTVVGPVGGAKEREFECGIVAQGIELFRIDGFVVFREEHRLAFAEGRIFRE